MKLLFELSIWVLPERIDFVYFGAKVIDFFAFDSLQFGKVLDFFTVASITRIQWLSLFVLFKALGISIEIIESVLPEKILFLSFDMCEVS